MEFLGFSPPSDRPYSDVPDEELVEQYALIRLKLEDDEDHEPTRELVPVAYRLMEEWEWRHSGLEEFDERADRREAELRDTGE